MISERAGFERAGKPFRHGLVLHFTVVIIAQVLTLTFVTNLAKCYFEGNFKHLLFAHISAGLKVFFIAKDCHHLLLYQMSSAAGMEKTPECIYIYACRESTGFLFTHFHFLEYNLKLREIVLLGIEKILFVVWKRLKTIMFTRNVSASSSSLSAVLFMLFEVLRTDLDRH